MTNNNEKSFKLKDIFRLLSYYKNFQNGLKNGKIYHELKTQNTKVEELISKFSDNDLNLINTLFKMDVKNYLRTKKLCSKLDFDKRQASNQIGFNTVFIEKPIKGLWTTGKSTFYLPTKKGLQNKITIKLFSIAPVNVVIGFDGKEYKTLSIPKLSTKILEIRLLPKEIIDDISEISISTDKLWLPSVVLDFKESLTLGICVRSIDVSYV